MRHPAKTEQTLIEETSDNRLQRDILSGHTFLVLFTMSYAPLCTICLQYTCNHFFNVKYQ